MTKTVLQLVFIIPFAYFLVSDMSPLPKIAYKITQQSYDSIKKENLSPRILKRIHPLIDKYFTDCLSISENTIKKLKEKKFSKGTIFSLDGLKHKKFFTAEDFLNEVNYHLPKRLSKKNEAILIEASRQDVDASFRSTIRERTSFSISHQDEGLIIKHVEKEYPRTTIYIPFYKHAFINIGQIGYLIFIIFAVYAIINALNITDGKDGLLGGTSAVTLGVFLVFAFVIGQPGSADMLIFLHIPGTLEIVVFCAAVIGALFGFLWFNTYPAEVFMGDTGSLAIGNTVALTAFLLKQEILFVVVGGIFVLHMFTSFVQQEIGDKRMGRRIFYRAPFHHTLSHRGIAEPKVVVRIWLISIILALIGLLSLKIR